MVERVAAIVPAAGRGVRMGMKTPKQFLSLGGMPLLIHTLRLLEVIDHIYEIVLVVPETDFEMCRQEVLPQFRFTKVIRLIQGGAQRQDSVRHGLEAVSQDCELVLVHDAVRPFLTKAMVEQAIQAASLHGAAIVGIPMRDTVKRVSGNRMVETTLDRAPLWLAQTPQVFRTSLLKEAHHWAVREGVNATDDAALVEQMGEAVAVVEGSTENIKITRPEDLVVGEAIWAARTSS